MAEGLVSLAYVSSATELFSDEQLERLLAYSRAANERHGITGMLLYSGGNFAQVLEGPADAVRATFQHILTSDRHHGVIVLFEKAVAQREFGDWSMAFRRCDTQALDSLQDPGEAHQLLQSIWTTFR